MTERLSRDEELAMLIAEQRVDQTLGDQVHGPSINNDVWDDDDGLIVYDSGTYIFVRPPYRHRRQAGILGFKARRRKSQHHARHICQSCGAWCDQRTHRCKDCYLNQVAFAHGTHRRYMQGCRCEDCVSFHREYHRKYRIAHGQPESRPPLQPCGTNASYNRGCRCDECRQARAVYYKQRAA